VQASIAMEVALNTTASQGKTKIMLHLSLSFLLK